MIPNFFCPILARPALDRPAFLPFRVWEALPYCKFPPPSRFETGERGSLEGNLLQGFLKGIYKGSILCTVAAAARVLVELIAGRPFDGFDTCKHLVDKPCGYNAATRP